MTHNHKFIFLSILSTFSACCLAEGTRELQPISSDGLQLYISKDPAGYGRFATPNCAPEEKLWVSIAEAGEKILFGFQKTISTNTIKVAIYNTSGVAIFPETLIPNSGTGYISDWDQAVAGPVTINPDGYTPFQVTITEPGDYYIEFNWEESVIARQISFFDITVVDASGVEKRGRLWSKNWQMYAPNKSWDEYAPFNGKMFPYTDDQITTKIDFNGMAPARFNVACNSTGCANTGNFLNDRKSRDGNVTYPAYKIFINNPDETLFPTGIVGGVDSVRFNNPCDGTVDILLYVNKQGMADILLNINPLAGYQAEDVILNDTVFSGNASVIHWDGLNGLGEPIPNGTFFNIEINYVNGLTHLPLYDVEYSQYGENKWAGFIVDLVRPAGDKPKVYWDDSGPGLTYTGTVNLDGCISPTGCHFWGDALGHQGNEATINTWWFAVSTTLLPITIQYRRSETIPVSYILCEGDSVNVFGNWVNEPGVFRDTATNFLGCDSITEVTVTVKPGPVIDLGPDQLLCQGESTTLGYVVSDVTDYEWNTVPPGPAPLAVTPTLTVTATATYQVQITATNGCIRTDQVHVTAAPIINQKLIRHD